MGLNVKNFALAGGILWGAAMFVMTLIALSTNYGIEILSLISTVYIGYTVSFMGAIIGAIWGFLDAFIGLYIFAWLYNWLGKR